MKHYRARLFMIGQGLALNHHRERVTSGFYAERHLSCLSELVKVSVNQNVHVKELQAPIGLSARKTGNADRRALKRVFGRACMRPETFQTMMKIDIVSRKTNFYL